jgi:hypothetical protein
MKEIETKGLQKTVTSEGRKCNMKEREAGVRDNRERGCLHPLSHSSI